MADAVEELVEEMKTPEKFDFRAALNGQSYPTGSVSIFLDGHKAQELHDVADELEDAKAQTIIYSSGSEGNGGIVDDPEKVELDEKIAALEARQEELIGEIRASRITFHLRGVVPKLWRSIVRKVNATKELAPADKTNEEDVAESNMKRNDRVNYELAAHAIVKVENADGAVDDSAWTWQDVENLHGALIESEWFKLKNKADELTFANTLFDKLVESDPDFLPKS